jgi:hypothetical protein
MDYWLSAKSSPIYIQLFEWSMKPTQRGSVDLPRFGKGIRAGARFSHPTVPGTGAKPVPDSENTDRTGAHQENMRSSGTPDFSRRNCC